jgi:3-hydroxybutyryl-CoA dehydrogenase
MEIKDLKKVLVLGGGTMGNGIAHVCAMKGYDVLLKDVNDDLLKRAIGTIDKNLDRMVKKGSLSAEDKAAAIGRIKGVTTYDGAKECQLVVEAINENLDLKKLIFKELDELLPAGAILGTNTSSQSITEIAAVTKRPENVIGIHFFNPVPLMKLVEIVRGFLTDDATVKFVRDFSLALDKTPIVVKDFPGFATSRFLMVMINEAVQAYSEGVASAEDIDTGMKLGMNHPMGPLALADLIGIDVCLNVMERLYSAYNDPKYRPALLMKQMVAAGLHGRKNGRGFYKYES